MNYDFKKKMVCIMKYWYNYNVIIPTVRGLCNNPLLFLSIRQKTYIYLPHIICMPYYCSDKFARQC